MTAARVTKKPKPKKPGANGHLPPAIPPVPVRRFTVEEYHKLGELGILTENDRVELIHGWIVPKMVLNPPHNYAVTALMELFVPFVTGATVRVQQPISVAGSEPEPDVVLALGSRSDYKARHPAPPDCALVVEVADSSLRDDRTTKLQLYAGAKVAVYWIVNIGERIVEVYTEPKGGKNPAYRTRTDYAATDSVPVVIAGKTLGSIAVKDLLP
jgi:Uma2 family endonuclease